MLPVVEDLRVVVCRDCSNRTAAYNSRSNAHSSPDSGFGCTADGAGVCDDSGVSCKSDGADASCGCPHPVIGRVQSTGHGVQTVLYAVQESKTRGSLLLMGSPPAYR